MFPSYRDQSIDLLCKSTGWFLCNENIGSYWVKDTESMEDENLDYEKNNMDNSNENDDEDDKLVLVEEGDNINGD